MHLIALLNITAAVAYLTFSTVFGAEVPSRSNDTAYQKEILAAIPKTCPAECIYVKECGVGQESYLNSDIPKHKNDTDPANPNILRPYFFANGRGECDYLYLLDRKYCTIRDQIECLSKCGGPTCASPENYSFLEKQYYEQPELQAKIQKYRNTTRTG